MDLLIGTTEGAFVLADAGVEKLIGGTSVNHLARDREGWWAADGAGRIHHNGSSIASMPDDVSAWCVQWTPETTWVGANEARLYAVDHDGVTEDEFFATAPGRDSWYTPWGAPADVRSMTLDADHTLYINVHVGGILRYDNTGVVPTLDIDADVHQVAAHPSLKGAVFAATAHGLAQTHNGHDFDFRSQGLHATYCRAVAVLEDRVLVSASTGPRSDRARLYGSGLWEGPFEPLTSGLPVWFEQNLNTHCLVARDGALYAGQGDTVWRSDDRGNTWEAAVGELPRITCLA